MKKTFALLGFLFLNISVSFWASSLTTNSVSAIENMCDGGTLSRTYYVGGSPWYFEDYLWGINNKHYLVRPSAANIYNPYGALVFQNGGDFIYQSQIKPRGLDSVKVVWQKQWAGTLIASHAWKRTDIAAQIVYKISRQIENGTQSTNKTYTYMTNNWVVSQVSTNASFNSNITTDNECFNIYVGWCGDGVLDNGNSNEVNGIANNNGQLAGGEQCDNGSLNGKDGKCTLDCKSISTPNPYCGDGLINQTSEQCDSGSQNGKDGKCTLDCKTISTPNPYCGDGLINQTSEQCDNGSQNGKDGRCTLDCKIISTPSTKLTLHKSIVNDIVYYSWDTVTWRIDFSNAGTVDAYQVVLEDTLPISLEYMSSSIFGVSSTAKGSVYTLWWVTIIQYSGFDLKAWAYGYILISWKVKWDKDYSFYRTNCSLLSAKGFPSLDSCALYQYGDKPVAEPICKNITTNTATNGKDVHVFCYGENTVADSTPMSIDCGNGNVLAWYANAHGLFSRTCSFSSVAKAKNAKISCDVGKDTNNQNCITSWNESCSMDSNAMVAIVGSDDDDGKIKYTCETKNGQEAYLQIICGNGKKSDKSKDNKISYTCTYDEDDYEDADNDDKTITAKCEVDGDVACSIDTILDKWFIGYCGNGKREGLEQCDWGGERGEWTWKGKKCLKGCTLCDVCNDEVTQCLSIGNGNASVQANEYLPFWWRMYKPNYILDNAKCDGKNDEWNIKRSSMKCSFSLWQPGEDKPVTILSDQDCDADKIGSQALFKHFYPEYWGKAYGTWFINLGIELNKSAFKKDVLWEYKLRLHEVDYTYCACGEDGFCKWKDTQINNVCEVNFPITKPYMIQKSAFGFTPKATNTAKLKNFLDIEGNELINKTDLADVMVLDEDNYDGGEDAQFLIMTEAAKIGKLAVKLDASKLPNALKTIQNIKKVPNKPIYLIEAATAGTKLSLTPASISSTTPFTIITKNIDLTIVWSLNVNGMFVTQKGSITFQEDSSNRCNQPQVVKGIFVAGNGFSSKDSNGSTKIINNILTTPWCMNGNLHVQWILIGNNIDSLIEGRRSNLNNWFNVSWSEKAIKIQRRNQILDGASLLIEYNPNLWKQLPPGADQFINLLDVYKK